MKKNPTHIGIIGYGNMGSAIASKIISSYPVCVFDKDLQKTVQGDHLAVTANIQELIASSQVIFLAVKPQDFRDVLSQIKGSISDKLIVSIAAGISTDYIEKVLGRARVVRVMPNLALRVNKGFTGICKGMFARAQDLRLVRKIFALSGEVLIVHEKMMDAVTAVASSGLGFFYYLIQDIPQSEWRMYIRTTFIPQLCRAAQHVGFNLTQAQRMVKAVVKGSLALLEASGESAHILCGRVTSKGGVTEAGLKFFSADRNAFVPAIAAAVKRAEELRR